MSISSEINRISGNVSDALTAIANKGVTVPSGSNSDDLADLIGQISGGGGGTTWETIYQNTVSIQDWGDDDNYVYIPNYSSSYEVFLIGDTYRITWQGVQYECVAYNQGGTACVGDLVNEPFLGDVDYSGNLLFETHDSPGTFSLKIEKQVSGGGGSTLITKTITENGTYDAEDDDADGYSEVTVAIPNGTAGTPTATKGTVSNHSVSVTPSVTNTGGVISGGTLTGTPVTVSASELVSGSETKTSNGTYDVTNLASLVVNVSGSSGKNAQVAHGTKRIAATAYTDVGYEITVAKTGTYNVYWAGWRSSTSGTNGAQLYVNGNASGDAITSFDATWTNVQNGSRTSVSLTQGDKVTLRARSRGTSYYMYIFFLSIEEA